MWGNSADTGGGIACVEDALATIRNCNVAGNIAAIGGGLVFFNAQGLVLDGVEVTENVAGEYGGGLYAVASGAGSAVQIRSSTFTRNHSADGGGMRLDGSGELDHTIIWGNCGTQGPELTVLLDVLRLRCCAVPDSGVHLVAGGHLEILDGQVQADPLFCDPGPCAEIPGWPPPLGSDYSLRSDSPCLAQFSPCAELVGALDLGCTAPYPVGACCDADNSCALLSHDDCLAQAGRYLGDGVSCFPDPCTGVATERTTWGRIKARFQE